MKERNVFMFYNIKILCVKAISHIDSKFYW